LSTANGQRLLIQKEARHVFNLVLQVILKRHQNGVESDHHLFTVTSRRVDIILFVSYAAFENLPLEYTQFQNFQLAHFVSRRKRAGDMRTHLFQLLLQVANLFAILLDKRLLL
jgi:hypothetical protein